MSENSESVHLWHRNASEVREIARDAGIIGRIVAHNERWTCFVPFEDGRSEFLAQKASGLALVWKYAEDFGLWITVFETGRHVGNLAFEWGVPATPAAERLLKWLTDRSAQEGLDDVLPLVAEVTPDGRNPKEVRDTVAARLGIAAYDWLSPQYARETPLEEIQDEFPEVEDVI